MRLAVAVDMEGNIFQHFGRTEEFKIYEIEDGKVLYSETVDSNGQGHSALAETLEDNAVSVLICGGIGMGAQVALDDAGIEMVTGISGSADEAVEQYLKGELKTGGATCDHHDHDHECCHHHHDHDHECCHHHDHDHDHDHDHECCHHHDHEDEDGHEEEHACGHCGHRVPPFEGPNVGKTCKTHYEGTFNDGTKFDSSYDRGEPLEFVCGAGMMIPGYDKAVATMKVGEIIHIHLIPEQAYGPLNPDLVMTFPIAQLPGSEELEVGMKVALTNAYGQPFPVTVTARDGDTITLDANHEMAGKELNFKIELVSVE